ncbi:MAG: hypothetical protein ACJAYE_002295 [Candidatus Azotimanducaceae bacterium]|jgi:hypothetical protein
MLIVRKAALAPAAEIQMPVGCSFANDAFAGKYCEEETVQPWSHHDMVVETVT